MTHHIIPALALLAAACASEPEYVWQPTDPSFGRDQTVTQHAFCGVLFDGLAMAADDPDDRRVLQKLHDATALRIAQLGADATDPNVRAGEHHAAVYAFGASPEQIISAGELCVEVVMAGGKAR